MPDRAIASPQTTRSLLTHPADFPHRHIGPGESEIAEMLEALGVSSLDELVEETVPDGIRLGEELDLPAPLSEPQALAELREKAAENQIFRSFIGMGYHDCTSTADFSRPQRSSMPASARPINQVAPWSLLRQ